MKEQLKGGRVKGGIPRAHLAWVKQQGGEKAVEDVLGRLPAAIGDEMRRVLATTWCAFESVILLDRAIAEKSLVAGYHWGLPNVGRIAKDGNGYAFTPAG